MKLKLYIDGRTDSRVFTSYEDVAREVEAVTRRGQLWDVRHDNPDRPLNDDETTELIDTIVAKVTGGEDDG